MKTLKIIPVIFLSFLACDEDNESAEYQTDSESVLDSNTETVSDTDTQTNDNENEDTGSDIDADTDADSDSEAGTDTETDSDTKQMAELVAVSAKTLKQELEDKDFLLINVHVPYEGEIPGTDAHISYLEIGDLVSYLGQDLTVKVIIYCKSNYMAKIAGNALVEQGYLAIHYLDGGMSGWVAAGYTLDQ